jgi:hypothetical protein
MTITDDEIKEFRILEEQLWESRIRAPLNARLRKFFPHYVDILGINTQSAFKFCNENFGNRFFGFGSYYYAEARWDWVSGRPCFKTEEDAVFFKLGFSPE